MQTRSSRATTPWISSPVKPRRNQMSISIPTCFRAEYEHPQPGKDIMQTLKALWAVKDKSGLEVFAGISLRLKLRVKNNPKGQIFRTAAAPPHFPPNRLPWYLDKMEC